MLTYQVHDDPGVGEIDKSTHLPTSERNQLCEMNRKYKTMQSEISSAKSREDELKDLIKTLENESQKTKDRLTHEQKISSRYKKDAESNAQNYLRVKAEKKSLKQKADGLAKELSRICKNGKNIKDIEAIIHEHGLMKIEIGLLRTQKRQALEELKKCNAAYTDSIEARERVGNGERDAIRALERMAELERVVAETTEYLNAKEMQLDTMREVNRSLTEEMRRLAERSLEDNDV